MSQATARSAAGRVVRRVAIGAALTLSLATGVLPASATAAAGAAPEAESIYLVTLDGPGLSGYRGILPRDLQQLSMQREQDLSLGSVGAASPLYRWTSALNGYAARLTRDQADALASQPGVALVEKNSVRRLAGTSAPGRGAVGPVGNRQRGGAGTVIGIVDSGIWPESPLFSAVPGLGRAPRGFRGTCETGPGWGNGACNRKLVAARWFVEGFGQDRVRSFSSLSPRDDDGHGTQMASIAAGNADVSVRVSGRRLGTYSGAAPQARLAVYKACWTAPDPADDGCATADLVTAIDRATRDGVDVLNLSVGGPGGIDTVERALLGAAEADIVVVAAAGNSGDRAFAAHATPWVTTVGGTTGVTRRGRVELDSGPALVGSMSSTRFVGPAPLVLGSEVAAAGWTTDQARLCLPGSLDAAQVSGAIVFCERGKIGRVDKSAAVQRADGVAMVLANVAPGATAADFHSVPTVHLTRARAESVRQWLARHPDGRISLRSLGAERARPRVLSSSSGGDPTAPVLKPDLVAPAQAVLGAVPPSIGSTRWDFASGTSAATAYVSGVAAVLVRRSGWSASAVRSALATSATSVGSRSLLQAGAGRVRAGAAQRPGLVYALTAAKDYRGWLEGSRPALNTPSILMTGKRSSSATRTITNVGRRAMYFSSSATGFTRHQVEVTPAAVRLAPGESATYTVTLNRGRSGAQPLDDGWVTWLGANGTRTRIPVVITR